jgi:hypothetical protein
MYILGLFSSCGTSQICPAWSPSEHQLTPALSPIWGPCPKPRRPEEVVYSLNDSCSHFTQCLFPRNFLGDIHILFLIIHSILIHTYYTSHSNKQSHPFIYMTNHSFISSAFHSRPAALGLLCPIHWVLNHCSKIHFYR